MGIVVARLARRVERTGCGPFLLDSARAALTSGWREMSNEVKKKTSPPIARLARAPPRHSQPPTQNDKYGWGSKPGNHPRATRLATIAVSVQDTYSERYSGTYTPHLSPGTPVRSRTLARVQPANVASTRSWPGWLQVARAGVELQHDRARTLMKVGLLVGLGPLRVEELLHLQRSSRGRPAVPRA